MKKEQKYYLVEKVKDGWFKHHYELVLLSKKNETLLEWGIQSKRLWLRCGAILTVKNGDIEVEK